MNPSVTIEPNKEHPHLVDVWEPLPTKAPGPHLTQPYCCYINTVIFYLKPYVVRPWHHFWICNGRRKAEKPGHSYEEWDRVETSLAIDETVTHNGRRFRCSGGRVVWRNKRWWMFRMAWPIRENG